MKRTLPKNLKLGVATAAYQIEGAWNAAGIHFFWYSLD